MRIPLINPQPHRTGGKSKRGKSMAKKKKTKRRPSYRKRRSVKRKTAPVKSKRKSRRVRRKASASGKKRPVIRKKKGKYYRGSGTKLGAKRSTLPKRIAFANPVGGTLAMIGNPKRRKKKKGSYKKKGKRRRYRNPGALALRGTPGKILGAGKQIVSASFIQEAVMSAVGFVLPDMLVAYYPPIMRDAQWKLYASKGLSVAVISTVAGMVSKKAQRAVLLGGGISIALDAYADFVAPYVAGMTEGGTSHYYGNADDSGVGAYYGTEDDRGVASSLADAL